MKYVLAWLCLIVFAGGVSVALALLLPGQEYSILKLSLNFGLGIIYGMLTAERLPLMKWLKP